MADTQALARLEKSASMQITQPQQLAERIREWKEVANVLSPAVSISALAPQHVISPAVVVMDTRVDDQGVGVDVYHSNLFHRSRDERSLTKVALNKIASAAGASFTTKRTDNRLVPNYWEMQARLAYVDLDGTPRVVERTAEVDLRDGSPQTNGMKPGQIAQARRFGLRLCEAKACNAAARDAWGIPSKYTERDLQKPFITLRVSFQPDMSDPEQRRIVAERALMGTSALYPDRRRLEGAAPEVIDVEPQPVRQPDQNQQNVESAQKTAEERREPEKPTGPLVVEVKSQSGTTKPSKEHPKGRPYTRYFVVLSTGEELHTFDQQIALAAEKFKVDQTPVDVSSQESRFGKDIVEIRPAGEQPDLPIDEVTDDDLRAAKY